MTTVNFSTHTATGTSGRDKLRGESADPWTLRGLAGDDFYIFRDFEAYETLPGGGVYTYQARDKIVEQPNGGYDTVELDNGYAAQASISRSELANIEKIVVAPHSTYGWSIEANDLANVITGGGGPDTIDGEGGGDSIAGGDGNDVLRGGAGNDTLSGNDGNDSLYGDGGRNRLVGGAGDDTFFAGIGIDTAVGGTGSDTLNFLALHKAVTIDLATSTASTHERFSSIENATGTKYGDVLRGSSGSNVLTGGAGGDRIAGADGNDTISGGAGDDTLNGGAGNDVIDSGGGLDALTGGAGQDTFAFDFTAIHTIHDHLYVYYKRTVAFHDTITDFTDKVDHIAIRPFTEASAGVGGTDKAPTLDDIYLRQIGSDTIVYFGNPQNSGEARNPHDVYFGSVTLKNVASASVSASDFTLI